MLSGRSAWTSESPEGRNQPEEMMLIDGVVRDVSSYLHQHPGGSAVLQAFEHTDARDAFEAVGHSAAARRRLAALPFWSIQRSEAPAGEAASPASSRTTTEATCTSLAAP